MLYIARVPSLKYIGKYSIKMKSMHFTDSVNIQYVMFHNVYIHHILNCRSHFHCFSPLCCCTLIVNAYLKLKNGITGVNCKEYLFNFILLYHLAILFCSFQECSASSCHPVFNFLLLSLRYKKCQMWQNCFI